LSPLDRLGNRYYFLEKSNTEAIMGTTVTSKGQVTLPKQVRDKVGIRPGDQVEIRATASGGVYIEKRGAKGSYRRRLEALAKRRLVRGITTDEYMKLMRGDPNEDGDK
jgi:antitoxin PrlF